LTFANVYIVHCSTPVQLHERSTWELLNLRDKGGNIAVGNATLHIYQQNFIGDGSEPY